MATAKKRCPPCSACRLSRETGIPGGQSRSQRWYWCPRKRLRKASLGWTAVGLMDGERGDTGGSCHIDVILGHSVAKQSSCDQERGRMIHPT